MRSFDGFFVFDFLCFELWIVGVLFLLFLLFVFGFVCGSIGGVLDIDLWWEIIDGVFCLWVVFVKSFDWFFGVGVLWIEWFRIGVLFLFFWWFVLEFDEGNKWGGIEVVLL